MPELVSKQPFNPGILQAKGGSIRYRLARKKPGQTDGPLAMAMAIMEKEYYDSIFDAEPARRIVGIYKEREGYRTYSLTDESGAQHELKWEDSQTVSEWSDESSQRRNPIEDDCRARARNPALSAHDRLEALLEWSRSDSDNASDFILGELRNEDAQPAWRNAVIYAADAVEFRLPESREQLCGELIRAARSMRDSQAQDDRPVVLCAIHRAGSIIPRSRVGELEGFLEPGGAIDTRLAALQAIVRIFEATPPDDPSLTTKIADRSVTLATKRWDVDVFAAGEFSAMTIEGTIVAAVLGDDRLETLLNDAMSLGKSWVTRKLTRRLDEVRGFRVSRGTDVSALDQALEKLKNEGHRDVGGSE